MSMRYAQAAPLQTWAYPAPYAPPNVAHFCFDFETFPITALTPIPTAVCMSWAEVLWHEGKPYVGASGVVTAEEGIKMLLAHLRAGSYFIGMNTPFDAMVSIGSSKDINLLERLWVQAIEEDRVTDVLLRQKLIDLARGYLRKHYNLATIVERHSKRLLDKSDPWRLKYGHLYGLPIDQYPCEAYDYSLGDAIGTAEAFCGQHLDRCAGSEYFPGADMLQSQHERLRTAYSLKDTENWGLHADPYSVDLFVRETEAAQQVARDDLVSTTARPLPHLVELLASRKLTPKAVQDARVKMHATTVRKVTKKDKAGTVSYIEEHGLGQHYKNAKTGKYQLTQAKHAQSGDYLLNQLPKFPEVDIQELFDAGLIDIQYTVTESAAHALMLSTWDPRLPPLYEETRRAQPAAVAGLTDTVQIEKALEKHWSAFRAVAKMMQGGKVTKTGQVSLDGDACQLAANDVLDANDPERAERARALRVFHEYKTICKTLSSDIPYLIQGCYEPIHTRYDSLKKTGRSGTSAPNEQNMPRKPGVRECWVAPSGWVYISADYRAVELYGFAQICYDAVGFSKVGDALNAGIDLHTQMGGEYLGLTYEEAKAAYDAGEEDMETARTLGKGVNFGCKGGMSAARFVDYCWNNYGKAITNEQADELLALHARVCAEMSEYTAWVKTFQRENKFGSRFDIIQPYSGRLRANCAYTDAHNSPFQGLAADLAAKALWAVFKATRGLSELGVNDPLYGCRQVLFVHDELVCLAPEGRAHAAAMRLKEIMEWAGRLVMPRCSPPAEPMVHRQLSKLAKPIYNADGTLRPWCVWEQCTLTAQQAESEKRSKKLRKFPTFVLNEVLRREQVAA